MISIDSNINHSSHLRLVLLKYSEVHFRQGEYKILDSLDPLWTLLNFEVENNEIGGIPHKQINLPQNGVEACL